MIFFLFPLLLFDYFYVNKLCMVKEIIVFFFFLMINLFIYYHITIIKDWAVELIDRKPELGRKVPEEVRKEAELVRKSQLI